MQKVNISYFKFVFPFALLIFHIFSINAQIGGKNSFVYANMTPTARLAAVGGTQVSLVDDRNLSLSYFNPALLSDTQSNTICLNYINFLTDINQGYASFATNIKNVGMFALHVFFLDYGNFEGRDETGNFTGNFNANDYVVQLGYSKNIGSWSYGLSLKYLYSAYEAFVGVALASDIGIAYNNKEKQFSAGLSFRNMGYNFIPFETEKANLPFTIDLGFNKKLAHSPLRFTLNLTDLQNWNLAYSNPNTRNKNIDLSTGEEIIDEPNFANEFFRHINIGTELIFSPNFCLRFGYDHQQRKELVPDGRSGLTGFSWGFGLGIKKFYLDFASRTFFPGQNALYFSIGKNLNDFRRVN